MSGRNSILRGQIIELTAVFVDAASEFTDPTDLTFSIYPPGSNPELGAPLSAAWVYNVTLSDGGLGPYAIVGNTVEKTSVGHYKYTFAIPEDAPLGAGFDRWEAVIDYEDLDAVFTFTIVGGGSVGTTKLYENNAVFLSLSDSIKATDGSSLEDTTITYFTTTYNPLYTHVRRIRLELGPLVSDLYDDTINLAIFEAGQMADANVFVSPVNASYLNHAKSEYTICQACLILLRALSGDASLFGAMRKQLSDLSVSRSGSPQLMKNIEDYERCVVEWELVLQTGADKTPYTSLKPGFTVKGANSEDAMTTSRQWHPTSSLGRPAANNRGTGYTSRKGLRTFKNRYDPYYKKTNRDYD